MAFQDALQPHKEYKCYVSHEGGIVRPTVISWSNGIVARGKIRNNYVNVCDI